MKLKYYLRGLGIGILVTVMIVAISGAGKKTMTDEEIKSRAKELGMIENTVLASTPSASPEVPAPPESVAPPEITETPAPMESATPPEITEIPAPLESVAPPETPVPTATGETSAEAGGKDTVAVVISRGESSVSVSRTLAQLGLIESATEFDKYLCDGGYDKKIRTGTYEIPQGADAAEIAQIITRGN